MYTVYILNFTSTAVSNGFSVSHKPGHGDQYAMWGAPKQRKTGVKTLSPLEQVSPEYIIRILGSIITTSTKLYRQLYVQSFLHLQWTSVQNLVSVLFDFRTTMSTF